MQSTTTTITTQSTTEFVNWLNAGTFLSYKLGGKIEAGYEAFRTACMKEVIGLTSANLGGGRTKGAAASRKRIAATTPTVEVTPTSMPRRRGRPPKSTASPGVKTPRVKKNSAVVSQVNSAILKCIAAGYGTPTAMIPELARAYGIVIRPNHLGIALARLTRSKQVENNNGIWSLTATGAQFAMAA